MIKSWTDHFRQMAIDKKIKPLIVRLNKQGLITKACCAGIGPSMTDRKAVKKHPWHHFPYIWFDTEQIDIKKIRSAGAKFFSLNEEVHIPFIMEYQELAINPSDIGPIHMEFKWPRMFPLFDLSVGLSMRPLSTATHAVEQDAPIFFGMEEYEGFGIYFSRHLAMALRGVVNNHPNMEGRVSKYTRELKRKWLHLVYDLLQ